MSDLQLWRMLRRRERTPEELLPLLRQFAEWPLEQRRPFFGLLPNILGHPDSDIRGAALAALSGARGQLGLQWLVHALQDTDPAVQLQAVEALRLSTTEGDWPRFAHALFHPSSAIRQAAFQPGRPFPPPAWHRMFLLPDPEFPDAVRPADEPLSGEALPVLLDYLQRGNVPQERVNEWILRIHPSEAILQLMQMPGRNDEEIQQSLETLEKMEPTQPSAFEGVVGSDPFDTYFALAWGPAAQRSYGTEVGGRLLEQMLDGGDGLRRRVVVALIEAARRLGCWPFGLSDVCTAFMPTVLGWSVVPLEVRRSSISVLYQLNERSPRLPVGIVRQFAGSNLARQAIESAPEERGEPDLWVLGGLLRLLREDPFRELLNWASREQVQQALGSRPDLARGLFSVPGDYSTQQRAEWVVRLCPPQTSSPELQALLAWASSGSERAEYIPKDGKAALEVLVRLLDLTRESTWSLSKSRSEGLARLFGHRVHPDHIADFLKAWLSREEPTASPLGHALLVRLAQFHDQAAVVQAARTLDAEQMTRLVEVVTNHPVPSALAEQLGVGGTSPTQDPDPTPATDDTREIAPSSEATSPEGTEPTSVPPPEGQGEEGLTRLVAVLQQSPLPEDWTGLLKGSTTWPEGASLEALRQLVRDPGAPPEVRFRVGLALQERGDSLAQELMEAVCAPDTPGWFQSDDWEAIKKTAPRPARPWLFRLASSPHPAAYGPVIQKLTRTQNAHPEVRQTLRDFLERGPSRALDARMRAARWLHEHGEDRSFEWSGFSGFASQWHGTSRDFHSTSTRPSESTNLRKDASPTTEPAKKRKPCDRGDTLPILLQAKPTEEPGYPELLCGVPRDLVDATVSSILAGGQGEQAEKMLLALLKHRRVNWGARQEGLSRLMSQASSADVRQEARKEARSGRLGRYHKLHRVAQVFAWGVRISRQLMGQPYRLEMLTDENLGYTRLRENKLYISPLPVLRGEANGVEVVQALILHELGHHMYHRGEAAEEVWEQAENEELGRLLNLVADEHLERNLRARNRQFGDWLKLLAAYAFQHTARQLPVEQILNTLKGRSWEVLTRVRLRFARRPGCVAIGNGELLLEMERAGLSFARFLRALRMGLGNRHGDPRVEQALALFRDQFRHSEMPRLLEIARELRKIFGDEANILENFSQDQALGLDGSEGQAIAEAAEGITSEELQQAIQGVFEVRQTPSPLQRRNKDGFGRLLNLAEEEQFEPITEIIKVPHDPAAHAIYAATVARQAQRLREFFDRMGLGLEPQRSRLRGMRLDRSRLRPLVLRGDPRILIAREVRLQTDLHLGVIIDCSGSMTGGNIEKAKRFGTLLSEAVKGHRGIDLRLYGFTDQVIYDCGTARRCSVHGLDADNGNNDAAALWHAAREALASPRKARLLVMISDGSPTGCSVEALTALVQRLTHRCQIACAQVAVCPLDHVCFPHYIVLEEDHPEESVRRFGQIITRLVRKVMS